MERYIKFRGKTDMPGHDPKWVYGDYFSQFKDGKTTHYIVTHPYGRDAGREVMWVADPATVGQYTGLKDKKGADIYEGDLLSPLNIKINAYLLVGGERPDYVIVEYSAPRFEFVAAKKDGSMRTSWPIDPRYFEITGSIHDTPNPSGGSDE